MLGRREVVPGSCRLPVVAVGLFRSGLVSSSHRFSGRCGVTPFPTSGPIGIERRPITVAATLATDEDCVERCQCWLPQMLEYAGLTGNNSPSADEVMAAILLRNTAVGIPDTLRRNSFP